MTTSTVIFQTALMTWLDENGLGCWRFSRICGVHYTKLNRYRKGLVLPTLVEAHQIAQATNGEVSLESWLSLPCAQEKWRSNYRTALKAVSAEAIANKHAVYHQRDLEYWRIKKRFAGDFEYFGNDFYGPFAETKFQRALAEPNNEIDTSDEMGDDDGWEKEEVTG